MPTVWLIRHAESPANAGLPTDDLATIALAARGQAQAGAIGAGFPTTPDLIVTSPCARTVTTAVPLQRRFPTVPHAEWPVHKFTYLAPARCVGTPLNADDPLDPAGLSARAEHRRDSSVSRLDRRALATRWRGRATPSRAGMVAWISHIRQLAREVVGRL